MRKSWLLILALLPLGYSPSAVALCGGPLTHNQFNRPLNYLDRDRQNLLFLNIVEREHFPHYTENLERGKNEVLPTGDIHYTLVQFPNHYRALNAMAKWQRMHARPPDANYWPTDCYFERALTFTPKDGNIYLIYGIHLHESKKYEDAVQAYEIALTLNEASPEAHYNLGLTYIELNQLAAARKHADRAYELGHPLPGLRNKLARASAR